jgi:FkbH-like protein
MTDILEPIRLVIWDLDETFWLGTLSEGGIEAFIEENHDLVRSLAARGIMSSICSKNDHAAVKAILQDKGLWPYFIFPSIDWSPKGSRVASLVDAVGLRPPTILFIDDNPSNRGEVAAAVPGIVVVSEDFAQKIGGHPMFVGKDDGELSRLAQYKLLERKHEDERRSAGDNTAFLRSCGIQVSIDYDVEKHIDRVIELVNRTNQLNFTKKRLPEDATQAKEEILDEIRYFGHQAGLVKVTDRYGDYGYVGFFLKTIGQGMRPGILKHFCFSCRTLGMGIERWVYQTLRKPCLSIIGEVLSDVKDATPVDWINKSDGKEDSVYCRKLDFSEIRLRGGCEIAALTHYFAVAGTVTCAETNTVTQSVFVLKCDLSTHLVHALRGDPSVHAALVALGNTPESLETKFFAPTSGRTLLILNLWGELHIPRYRHKADGFYVHVTVEGFMGWSEHRVGGELTAWSEAELNSKADDLELKPEVRKKLFKVVDELRENYLFCGVMKEDDIEENLNEIANQIPGGALLTLLLPTRLRLDRTISQRNVNYAKWCLECLGDRQNIRLIRIDDSITDPSELNQKIGDHFDRIVYYRLAESIMSRAV